MGAHDDVGQGLRILAADESESSLRAIDELLQSLGHTVAAHAVTLTEAARRIADEDPDLSVVVVDDDHEHALELIEEIGEYARGPVLALVDGTEAGFVERAAKRGVSAIARSDSPADVQAAIDVAVRRHAETAELTERVDKLEGALERRAVIERAKGILMERHGVDDRRAFSLLREHARARNRKVVDLAMAVTEGHGLLPGER